MQKKTVLFLSYYGHQKSFFSYLAGHLPKDVKVVNANIYKLLFYPQFIAWCLFSSITGIFQDNRKLTDDIINFSHKRFRARHPEISPFFIKLVRSIQIMRALCYYQFFKRFFQQKKADLIVVWNGLPLPIAAAVHAAREKDISLLFCENGYLPKTVVMDSQGVNAFNSLMGRPADFYQKISVNEADLKRLFDTTLIARPLNQKNINHKLKNESITENIVVPEEFIFLPLQVHDDSQILIHSPKFYDMYTLVNFCANETRFYNEKHHRNLKLVVKEHPSDYGRIDYQDLKERFPEIVFTKIAPTPELICKSKAVITVNSTVGIEALLYFKPVITLGNAFYNVPGAVYHLEPPSDSLEDILAQALHEKVNRELIEKFLYYLRYEYLVSIDRKNLEEADPTEAVRRILSLIKE